MKKLLLTTTDSDTHTQKFNLGTTAFDISSTPFIDGISGTPTLHYVGTMPNFDFPFPEE